MNSCPGLESEEAFIIDGNTIRKKIIDDRDATRGFREWPQNADDRFLFQRNFSKNTRCCKTHHKGVLLRKTASPLYRGGFSLGPVVNSWLMKSRCWN